MRLCNLHAKGYQVFFFFPIFFLTLPPPSCLINERVTVLSAPICQVGWWWGVGLPARLGKTAGVLPGSATHQSGDFKEGVVIELSHVKAMVAEAMVTADFFLSFFLS